MSAKTYPYSSIRTPVAPLWYMDSIERNQTAQNDIKTKISLNFVHDRDKIVDETDTEIDEYRKNLVD